MRSGQRGGVMGGQRSGVKGGQRSGVRGGQRVRLAEYSPFSICVLNIQPDNIQWDVMLIKACTHTVDRTKNTHQLTTHSQVS